MSFSDVSTAMLGVPDFLASHVRADQMTAPGDTARSSIQALSEVLAESNFMSYARKWRIA